MRLTFTAFIIFALSDLVSPNLYAQRLITADDVSQLTCSYLACGPGLSGLEFLSDNGSILAMQGSGLRKIDRLGIAVGTTLSSAVYVDASSWLYSLSNGPVVYYWKSGELIDSMVTPDRSHVLEIRVLDTTIIVRTSSGIAMCTSLESLNIGTKLAPFTVFAVAPFSHGVHVIGLDSISTFNNVDGTYTQVSSSVVSFSEAPYSSVSTLDGKHIFVATVGTDREYKLYQCSTGTPPSLIDSSLHPFALSCRGDSITAVSIDGIRTLTNSSLTIVPFSLSESEVFEFLPLSINESDSSLIVLGAHSFIAELSHARGWTIFSYLPREPGSGSTVLKEGDRVAGLCVDRRKTVIVPGRTVFEWTPVPIRGSCVGARASVARQAFIGRGELMTTWHTASPNLTFSQVGLDTVMCGYSVTRPDLWTESEGGDLYGLLSNPTDSFIQKSTDRGRTWNRYCPSQGHNNLVSFIFARGDSVWVFGGGLDGDTLDTTVYRTRSYMHIRLFKNGILQLVRSLHSISSFHSFTIRDGRLYAILHSNLVSTGPIRSFGYIELSSLTPITLYSDKSIRLNAFAFVGNNALFTDIGGDLMTYRKGDSDSSMRLVGTGLGFGTIESLCALNDSTTLLVSASTPPSVYAINLGQQTTSVQGEDTGEHLRTVSVDEVSPNPSASGFKIRLAIANGWPHSDVSIVVSSVLGQEVLSRPLPFCTISATNGSAIEIEIPCNTWPAGAYILSARSSRGLDSRVVIKY